jgi:radical SAM superfamily enzyme YgiQ (UPF0313 family)
MKLLFIQLPLVDHAYGYVLGNVPYAPSALAAYIKAHHRESIEIEHLPFVIANFASNRIILKYIRNTYPDAVCVTGYLWNIERSMALAEAVKQWNPGIKIYFGGPEIQEGSWALSSMRKGVDAFIAGEGEWFFDMLFTGRAEGPYERMVNGNRLIVQPESDLVDAGRITEPLTNRHLDTMADGSTFLEMTRGCPYRCSYCFYSKNCTRVRELPATVLYKALELHDVLDLSEIYILSPTFNTTKDFHGILRSIEERNRGVRLHTEMRTDGIDDGTAGLIYRAGFRSLEVGLQTLTPGAWKRIGRSGNPDKELRGMHELRSAGIELKIGVIPGLPGDTAKGFLSTVEKLGHLGFEDGIELYPLSLLPGTRIRDEGEREGVRYQKAPPYYLTEGWGFTHEELQYIHMQTESITGYSRRMDALPDFIYNESGILIGGLRFDGDRLPRWNNAGFERWIETSVFNFHIGLKRTKLTYERFSGLLHALPMEDQLYNIILYTDRVIDERTVLQCMRDLDRDSFFRRMHVFDEWTEGSCIRVFNVTEDTRIYLKALNEYGYIVPVFRLTEENYSNVVKVVKSEGVCIENLLVAGGVFGTARGFFNELSAREGLKVAFENEADQEAYYTMTGQEFIKWPFALRTHTL